MSHWVRQLRNARIPEEIIIGFYKRYGAMPSHVVDAILADDRRCGIGPLTLGSDPSCERHDLYMLLDKLGYPLESIAATQAKFLLGSISIGIVGGLTAAAALPKGIIGATVGTILQVARDLF